MVKTAEVAFGGTTTEAGTWAAIVWLLVRATVAPPAGAGPVRRTVPLFEVPPTTVPGLIVTPLPLAASVGAVTVRVALAVVPRTAEMLAEVV